MIISPALWQMLERLRTRLDLALEIFDPSLVPVYPGAVAEGTRSLDDPGAATSDRDTLLAALRTGQSLVITLRGRRTGVYPLRRDREIVGLLAIGVSASLDVASSRPVDSHGRLDHVAELTRAAIESDIAASASLNDERDRSRRLWTVLRFLSHLADVVSEEDMMQAVVHAAAVWFDLDARVYSRDLGGSFRLHTALPGIAPGERPSEIRPELLAMHPGTTRISSAAELEELGWHHPRGELLLMPVACEGETQWMLLLGGALEGDVEPTFAILSRSLGTLLERLAASRARQAEDRLRRLLAGRRLRAEALCSELLTEIASLVGASHGRVLLQSDRHVRALARFGRADMGPVPASVEAGAPHVSSDALAFTLRVGGASLARLELGAAPQRPFTSRVRPAADGAAAVLQIWLTGVLEAGEPSSTAAAIPREASPPAGFERRIEEEVERAKRFNLDVGLLLIDVPRTPPADQSHLLAPLMDTLRTELRRSDLLGRLDDGEIGALLVHTGSHGLGSVAGRVKARLEQSVRAQRVPPVALGRAAFSAECESAAALLEEARRDAARAPARC